jgi:polyphosphate glucokinase
MSALTLSFDIGGSHVKAALVDAGAQLLQPGVVRVETPRPCSPPACLAVMETLAVQLGSFDRIAVGFPGVVRHGHIKTAVNLGDELWRDFDLASALGQRLGKPTRVANDADVQGLAAIRGHGVELVVTLGTGFGTAIFQDGVLGPHLEIAHHPFRKDQTYEEQLGEKARKDAGNGKWSRRVGKAIETLRVLTFFDRMYIGGGNAKKLELELPHDCEIVPNTDGIRGGVWLWERREARPDSAPR